MSLHKKEFLVKYGKHRERVAAARSMIDNKPPQLDYMNMSGFHKVKQDYEIIRQRNRHHRELMANMNSIMRTTGVVHTFRPLTSTVHKRHGNKGEEVQLRKIELENQKLGKRILNVKPELHTFGEDVHKQQRKRYKRMSLKKQFAIPEQILSKYDNLNLAHSQKMLSKLFRPKVFFYYTVKDMVALGPIDIELYTEASPQVVLELVRICSNESIDKLKIVRLFRTLWIESEMVVDANTLIKKNIEYDMRALDHDSAGILSFSKRSVRDASRGVINFSISFKPLSVLNGRRIAFGRVVRGLRLLEFIQHFGTKNGKPIKEVTITQCGLYY